MWEWLFRRYLFILCLRISCFPPINVYLTAQVSVSHPRRREGRYLRFALRSAPDNPPRRTFCKTIARVQNGERQDSSSAFGIFPNSHLHQAEAVGGRGQRREGEMQRRRAPKRNRTELAERSRTLETWRVGAGGHTRQRRVESVCVCM